MYDGMMRSCFGSLMVYKPFGNQQYNILQVQLLKQFYKEKRGKNTITISYFMHIH